MGKAIARGATIPDSSTSGVVGQKSKEQAGKLTNSPNLEAEGQDEKITGKIPKKAGQIEKVLEKALVQTQA